MKFKSFEAGGFEAAAHLNPRRIQSLVGMKRRIAVVGRFNLDAGQRGKFFVLGPDSVREALAAPDALGNEETVRLVSGISNEAFIDEVRPLIEERLVANGEGETAVQTGAPSGQMEPGSRLHRINIYHLLYTGLELGASGRPELLGKNLLKQLEGDLNSYLELKADFDKVVAAFNAFLYQRQKADLKLRLIPSAGVRFQPNFRQSFFDYLLQEDPANAFDGSQLDWSAFGSTWTAGSREWFVTNVTLFKGVLLDAGANWFNETKRQALKADFIQRRRNVLRVCKTLGSKLMMCLPAYWMHYELFGKPPSEVSDPEIQALHDRIKGRTEADRKVRLASGGAVTLAAPTRTLGPEQRDQLAGLILARLGAFVEAWGRGDQKAMTDLMDWLRKQKVGDDALAKVERGLKAVADLCRYSSEGAADPVRALRQVIERVRGAWQSVARQQFLRVLVGPPATTLEDVRESYAAGLCELYVQAELYKDDTASAIHDKAREGRKYLSAELDRGAIDLTTAEGHLSASVLVPFCEGMNEQLVTRYQALSHYVRLQARWLSGGGIAGEDETPHHAHTDAQGLGVAIEETPVTVIVAEAEASGRAVGGAPAAPAEAISTAPRSESKDAPAPAANNELRLLLEELAALSVEEGASDEGGADLTPGAEKLSVVAREALELIEATRKKAAAPERFRSLCRRVALAELMLIHHENLQLTPDVDLSSLYQLAMDLVVYGPGNLAEFLSRHSLTEYHQIDDPAGLFDRYERLRLQTLEAVRAMARFISEVRGVESLLNDPTVKQELARDAELWFFNGSANEFLAWINHTRALQQYWDPNSIGSPKFVRPSLIYILESAFAGPGENLNAWLGQVAAFQPNGPPRPCPLPPIMVSTTLAAGQQPHWSAELGAAVQGYELNGSLPTPVFAVGPAEVVAGSASEAACITRPVGFHVVSRLLTGQAPGNEVRGPADPHGQQLPRQFFSFTRAAMPVSRLIDELLTQGGPGRLPLEGAMWLHVVAVMHHYLAGALAAEPGWRQAFLDCFKRVPGIGENAYNARRQQREGVANCLAVLYPGDETTRYSLDTSGEHPQLAWLLSGPESVEVTASIPWFRL